MTSYKIHTLANDVLLVSKLLLGYEEALWLKKLEISHASQILTHDPQILVLSYYCNLKKLEIKLNFKRKFVLFC